MQLGKAELSPDALSWLRSSTGYQGNSLVKARMSAAKPDFEVGSSTQLKLSFGKKTPKPGRCLNDTFYVILANVDVCFTALCGIKCDWAIESPVLFH